MKKYHSGVSADPTAPEALRQARAGYSALAAAVSAGNTLAYEAARTQVYLAEARLGTALKQLNLLGYR